MKTFTRVIAGSSIAIAAMATIGIASASADTVTPPPPAPVMAPATPVQTLLDSLQNPVGFFDCTNAIGKGIGQGALLGGVSTIEAGGAGALPGGIGGGIVGAINGC